MLCPYIRRLLCLATLVYVLSNFVDFTSSEFDPIRTQWGGSINCLTNTKYYGDIVQPLQDKVGPYVGDINEQYIHYVAPSLTRVGAVIVDKYQALTSKYVTLLGEKFSTTPLYDIYVTQKPILVDLSKKSCGLFYKTREITTTYVATGLIKLNVLCKFASAHSCHYVRILKTSVVKCFLTYKPLLIAYYNDTVVPNAKCQYACLSAGTVKAWAAIQKSAFIGFEQMKKSYKTYVSPLTEQFICSPVKNAYVEYLKTYVDQTISFLKKYYNLFRLNQALNISKKLITGSYDQAVIYFKNDATSQSTKVVTPSVDTTAMEEVFPTPEATGVEYDAMPSPPVTEDEDDIVEQEVEDEIEPSVPSDAEGAIPESTSQGKELETESPMEYDQEIVLTLAQEISTWKQFIYESVDNIFNSFKGSIADMESLMVDEFRPKLTEKLQDMTNTAQLDYAVINKAIFNIDSKTVLLENGETAEVDRNGKIIDHKVTRQEFRDLLAEKNAILKEKADAVNLFLKTFVSELETAIEEERGIIVDVYEEFAEVAINEFSKKMMYSTFASSFDQLQNKKDGEGMSDWKEYLKIKKDIVNKRDVLTQESAELPQVQSMLAGIHETLRTLEHENGNYYAILRAQANLAFQAREKLEREEAQHLESDDDYTVTSTLVKFATINVDGEAETETVDIGEISEEELSDSGSDEEDFEVPSEMIDSEKTASSSVTQELEPETTVEPHFVVDTPVAVYQELPPDLQL